jgi:hypothetical protein
MLVATPQRTALSRCTEPTPAIAPVITWVVDTPTPNAVAIKIDIAPAVSAQKPPRGLRRVIREPMVCTMRQPPLNVPSPMAACADRMTQIGTLNTGRYLAETSTPVIRPMVFCASLVPCA